MPRVVADLSVNHFYFGHKGFMRAIVRVFITIAVLSVVVACGRNAKGSTSAIGFNPVMLARTITLTDATLEATIADTLSLGRMQSGEVIKQRIRLVNESSEPVVISEHRTTCGCTEAEYERQPIGVGKSADIVVSYDSRGEWGWRMQLLELTLARKDYPVKIYIDAEIY